MRAQLCHNIKSFLKLVFRQQQQPLETPAVLARPLTRGLETAQRRASQTSLRSRANGSLATFSPSSGSSKDDDTTKDTMVWITLYL